MKPVVSAAVSFDTLLGELENEVLFAADEALADEVDARDLHSVSDIIALHLARRSGAQRAHPGRAIRPSPLRSLLARPAPRLGGLSVAFSSEADDGTVVPPHDEGEARERPD